MNFTLASFSVSCLGLCAVASLIQDEPPRRFDFACDVLPILQRQGCSSAYCHGSATGRAGFKLSLFGSDAAADYAAIATQLGGRRLDLRAPDRSLLVQKALGHLDHGGGRRLPKGGVAHETLLAWIAAGAPWRAGEAEQLRSLRVSVRGERAVAEAGFGPAGAGDERQQVRDVSDVALFSTSDPTVVDVGADGQLDRRGAGQCWVMARFGNLTAVTRLVRPFASPAPSAGPAASHALDRAWRAHLDELGLQPADRVAAAPLARRLYLDLVGRPPTPQELDAFGAAPDVAATVLLLAGRREFAEVWGAHLADWFEVPDAGAKGPAAAAAARDRAALVQAVARGDSLPAIARAVALGEVGLLERLSDARDRAEYAGRTLLGKRIGCARCHDHPSDRWRRSEHLAFSACFASPRPDGAGGTMAGALFDPEAGERVEPRFLPLAPGGPEGPGENDRRRDVADFLLSRAHDAFARNACNRIFAFVFGRGLVEPVDDHRLGNPPLDPGMLDALVDAFHRGDGRLPALLTFVLTSAAYAAAPAQQEGPAATHLACRASRALPPDTFGRAVAAVVGRAPAVQLPGSALARELALRNGPMLHDLLAAGGTTVDATFDLCDTPGERLVELWRTVLSRAPRADEVLRFEPFAAERSAFRDLAYALLSGREFAHER
ncbi:MAG TPA: DUF1549 domain-containing protein [Planctomycetota bacterium]|nr:DUF1549 domain-containing protein [Planctomycetota bacterium]